MVVEEERTLATFGGRLARGCAEWLALGACSLVALSVSCGSSDATASSADDGANAGSVGVAGSGSAAAGAGGSAGDAPDASAGLTLCSTAIGPCKFDSAAQCPATQPAAGSSCGAAALVCYYCPVSAFSLAVSSCSNGSWSNTRASCGS